MNKSYTLQPCHWSQCIIYIILVLWNLMHLWTILMKMIRPVLYFILCDFLSNRLNLGSIFILDRWDSFKPFFLNYDFIFSEWYRMLEFDLNIEWWFRLSMSSKMIHKLWANYEIWIIVVSKKGNSCWNSLQCKQVK